MAKPVEIGSRSFRTQKSALEHYKEILHRYRDGERVADPSDHADLVALIERYDPILEEVGEPAKGGGQIGHFERRLNTGTGWSSPGFWVVRQDGNATDFSYIYAVKGQPGGRSKDFYGACREAVALDLIQAKKQAFAEYGDDQGRGECELTDYRRRPPGPRLAALRTHGEWLSSCQGLVQRHPGRCRIGSGRWPDDGQVHRHLGGRRFPCVPPRPSNPPNPFSDSQSADRQSGAKATIRVATFAVDQGNAERKWA